MNLQQVTEESDGILQKLFCEAYGLVSSVCSISTARGLASIDSFM